MNVKAIATAVLVTFGLASTSAFSATVTSTMPVKIIIQNACNVSTAPTLLDFGTQGPLVANIDSTATITLTFTTGATYNVGLSRSSFRTKVAVGTNPWTPVPASDLANIAAICERYGGGGHARVGAVSYPPDREDDARKVASEIAAELRERA